MDIFSVHVCCVCMKGGMCISVCVCACECVRISVRM